MPERIVYPYTKYIYLTQYLVLEVSLPGVLKLVDVDLQLYSRDVVSIFKFEIVTLVNRHSQNSHSCCIY